MSGDFQHYIPQQILRGFGVRAGDGTRCVWCFEKNAPASLRRIEEFGGGFFFYSMPSVGDKTLDDEITSYENRLTQLLRPLRKQRAGVVVDSASAAEVVAHLTIRTNSTRTGFARLAREAVVGMGALMSSNEFFCNHMGLDRAEPTELFRKVFVKSVKENPQISKVGLPLPVIERVLFGLAKENYRDLLDKSRPEFHATLAGMYAEADDIAASSHRKALAKELAPEQRVQILAGLHWEIIETDTGIVLPDCVGICIDNDDTASPLFFSEPEKAKLVAMPISKRRLLVGKVEPGATLDSSSFNIHAAACSEHFFVSATDAPDLAAYTKYIGLRPHNVVSKAIADALCEFRTRRSEPAERVASASIASIISTRQGDRRFSIRFTDCADEKTARAIAGAVFEEIDRLRDITPLNRLEGITFADNYPLALRELDRGFEASAPLTTIDDPTMQGVARSPLVLRDNVVMSHIVARGYVGHALLNDDDKVRRLARQILVNELAEASCAELFDMSLPGVLLRPFGSYFDAQRFAQVGFTWSIYFAAKVSSTILPWTGEHFREIAIEELNRARTEIPDLRLNYRFHGDHTAFLESALGYVGAILEHTARLLGHYDGISASPFDNQGALERTLNALGLRLWFDSYASDLKRLWSRGGKWDSFDEFLGLSIHVERILWQFGIFMWQTEDGNCRFEAPIAIDAKRLPKATLKRPGWLAKSLIQGLSTKIRMARGHHH